MMPESRNLFALALTFTFAVSTFALTTPVDAQTKYNPDDPAVEKIVQPMIEYIRKNSPEGGIGRRSLVALAIIESTKRYLGYVPVKDPLVIDACNQIASEMRKDSWDTASVDFNTMYAPCLAVLVLCEVDKEKYREEIIQLLAFIDSRQQGHGPWGYRSEPTVGDTSQVQYVALAAWVARNAGFEVKTTWGKGALDWLVKTQRNNSFDSKGDGGWGYKDGNTRETRQPIVAAGASTVYMIADWFGLNPKATNVVRKRKDDIELPRDVSVFVERKKGKDGKPIKKAVIEYNREQLGQCKTRANAWFGRNFAAEERLWNYYFLYAFERYAFFRETAEGPLTGRMKNWYDQGVEQILKDLENDDTGGKFVPDGPVAEADHTVNTALAVLFLVRSTQILADSNKTGELKGNQGFASGELKKRGGKLIGEEIARSTDELMKLLDDPANKDDLNRIKDSFKSLKLNGDSRSKAKQRAFIRGLVTHRKYGPRYVGVRYLANQREIDNVPALIYALSDPAADIALMAHNGLRFISRKIDTISLPANPKDDDFMRAKIQWEKWYLSIRPNAELLDK